MPTIGNLPGADLPVIFPSGETRTVNMIVMLVEVQYAESMAKSEAGEGLPLTSPEKAHRTVESLTEKYELDWFASDVFPNGIKTWDECAQAMRHVHTYFDNHIKAQRGI